MGPGSAQILRISRFVNSKTYGEYATVLSGFDGIPPPKKGLHGKMPQFCLDYDLISKTKKRSSVFHILISQCHFDGPSEAHAPSAGPLEGNGPHDRPPKIHGPWDHCPTLSSALQADNEFPPQGEWRSKFSTPEVRMWTAVGIYRSGGPDVDCSPPVE